jgi:hypothetical protein
VYKLWTEYLDHLPKKSKYSLGGKIDVVFLECIDLIFTASFQDRTKKLLYIEKASARFDLLKFLMRILWETKILDNKKYITLSTQLDEIGKMLGGWRNNLLKETQSPPRRG